MAERRGRLIVIAGPSGVGKGSVVQELLARDPGGLALSISATTRAPRTGEVDGRDYFFVTEERFQDMIDAGELLEWAEVFDHRYGTPKDYVESQLAQGSDVLLEIDVVGAAEVRRVHPDALLILLAPPSMAELTRRLRGRGTETDDKIARRLAKAAWELDQAGWFDHTVVNDDLSHASSQVAAIIEASRQRGSDV
ncbi:MAG: guanylate kinase [Actinomycetota bacterium]|nr:guanylate kinase [Actinomycetota bacterium]